MSYQLPRLSILYVARNGSPTYLALGLAAMAGILMGLGLLSLGHPPGTEFRRPYPRPGGIGPFDHHGLSPAIPEDFVHAPITNYDNPSLPQLHAMISSTKGYWARDYSLNLGWNNVSEPCTWYNEGSLTPSR